jgi:hypothetical protein
MGFDCIRVYALIAEVYARMNNVKDMIEYCNLYLDKSNLDDQKKNTINALTKYTNKLLRKYPKDKGLINLKERLIQKAGA